MFGVDGDPRGGESTPRSIVDRAASIALVKSLYSELRDGLRTVAWYADDDFGLLYVHSSVEPATEQLQKTVDRHRAPNGSEAEPFGVFEYAIDSYATVTVVALSTRICTPPVEGATGVAISIERDGRGLGGITSAIERAVRTSRRRR